MQLLLTFACLWMKLMNSVFQATARALRVFLTGAVSSWSGPNLKVAGILEICTGNMILQHMFDIE